jgi:DNA-binding NarL/FixJ family response regulator
LGSRNGTALDGVPVRTADFAVGSAIQIGQVTLDVVDDLESFENDDETGILDGGSGGFGGVFAKLSRGQTQVVRLLLDGLPEKEVAFALCLSRHTVHTHVKRIYRLLGVQSRAELMVRCLGG